MWVDTALDEDLIQEGLAREFVNKVQTLRKEMALEVTQRIEICFESTPEIEAAVQAHEAYIKAETLAHSCVAGKGSHEGVERDLNGYACNFIIEAVS